MEWKLQSGERVMDRHRSHLHEGVLALLPEALGRVDPQGRVFLVEEIVFGRLVGETTCVMTSSSDEIVYAQRPRRFGLTRFVKNRKAEPSSAVTVILKRDDREYDVFVLITAFVGNRSEPEPWDQRNFFQQPDPHEAERLSREFWSSRALVWGSEEVIPGTETNRCPW